MTKTLKERRIEAGLTLVELAQKLGVTMAQPQRWEVGDTLPRPRMIPKLAEVFGITAEEARQMIETTRRQAVAVREAKAATAHD